MRARGPTPPPLFLDPDTYMRERHVQRLRSESTMYAPDFQMLPFSHFSVSSPLTIISFLVNVSESVQFFPNTSGCCPALM